MTATLPVIIDPSGAIVGRAGFRRAKDGIARDARDLTSDMARLNRAIGGIATGVRLLVINEAINGFARLSASIPRLVTGFVKTGASVQDLRNQFEVTFKQSAADARRELEVFAEFLGLSDVRMEGFAATIGSTLIPLGFMRDDAAKLSVGVVKLAQDLSSIRDVDTADVIGRISSALVGNTEALRGIGITFAQAQVNTEAYRLGLARTGETLTLQQKALATLSVVLRQSGDAVGDARRTYGDFNNTVRRIRDEIFAASATMGDSLIPALQGTIEAMGGASGIGLLTSVTFRAIATSARILIDRLTGIIEAANKTFIGLQVVSRIDFSAFASAILRGENAVSALGKALKTAGAEFAILNQESDRSELERQLELQEQAALRLRETIQSLSGDLIAATQEAAKLGPATERPFFAAGDAAGTLASNARDAALGIEGVGEAGKKALVQLISLLTEAAFRALFLRAVTAGATGGLPTSPPGFPSPNGGIGFAAKGLGAVGVQQFQLGGFPQGVISSPTAFPINPRLTGVASEFGQPEVGFARNNGGAIAPLERDGSGRLGVRIVGDDRASGTINNNTFNFNFPRGTDVKGFRKSRRQMRQSEESVFAS